MNPGGWSGGAKVSCTSGHRGVQLILAYSWARPVILVAGKGRRGMFLFLLFLHSHSCSSFLPVISFISSTISSVSFLPVSGRRHKMTHKGWCVIKPQHNQNRHEPHWVDWAIKPQHKQTIRINRINMTVMLLVSGSLTDWRSWRMLQYLNSWLEDTQASLVIHFSMLCH